MQAEPRSRKTKVDYIDAVRGWAILLVVTSHVGGAISQLPYPIKKLTNFGWNGVQMFFLASAVTLMMSWHRQNKTFSVVTGDFFIRRFLRIAPMYYTGALIYLIVTPPPTGFDFLQLLRYFAFINTWYPTWLPTTPGWTVVPGGWSIGVEFTFYALFPVLVIGVTTLRRALLFTAVTLVIAFLANGWGLAWLKDYNPTEVRIFLYYWFPHQAPVFALGMTLFHLLNTAPAKVRTKKISYLLIALSGLTCLIAAEESPWFQIGAFDSMVYFVSVSFMAFIFALSNEKETILVHPLVRRIGVLSFSIYILHFAVIKIIPELFPWLVNINATGFAAIFYDIVLWVLTMLFTTVAATLSHKFIEQPGIKLAHRMTAFARTSIAPEFSS